MLAVRFALSALVALFAAAPAGASSVEVGAVAPAGATGPGCGGCTHVQVASAAGAPAYVVPGGVITEWRVRGGSTVASGDRMRLRVLRAFGAGWIVVGESNDATPVAGQAPRFFTRIRVTGGEALGLRAASGGDTPIAVDGAPGDVTGTWPSDPAPGADPGEPAATDARRLNVAVRVESDFDGDGLGDDTQDRDDDADGLPDRREGEVGSNPLDGDSDDDGADDGDDVCVLTVDPYQLDADLDRIGDFCDADDDDDRVSDAAEAFLRTKRLDADTDDDGLADGEEERRGTDLRRPDTDGDGLTDGLEAGMRRRVPDPPGLATGTEGRRFRPDLDPRSRTSPLRRDADRDGLADAREDRNRNGRRERTETDPSRRDTDGDAVPDGRERFPLDRRR